ncbi:TRAG family protein [Ruminiclostridium papyrosolvens DSM 2782]|uniref:TRAG family protein n=1 Tax=Ruminiclostridium papyrosolvens DSM 2782 TaxID=588581 RepID=F1TIJ2_9FIRM|nr:type IV secretory system conjugative DNA transfer family protein [Ruminiclostridium papyrosolvens]EGD45809.1 TRAG family protein [Ruminiclostridium papyrosolvens DSM 2782]WES33872.1 type IV secretory system conjugative DNA transfer family protein [Ruminiclostridium papyrosolvens DSM 2782]
MPSQVYTLIAVTAVAFFVIGGLSLLAHYYTLNGIKSKTVGDGQHGTARFATRNEIKRTYSHIPYEVEKWRRNENLPQVQGIVVGCKTSGKTVTALVDEGDVHCLMIGAAGVGKTANFLYPNLEYACASGMSFLTTDTKGDLFRNYGSIARDYYGYKVSVIDLRNPTRSDGNNMLHLVNKYMDEYLKDQDNLSLKARAERYAKITAKTIVNSGGMEAGAYGQNAFFYEAAEGLLTSVILLISEYCPPEKRHIISVFKLIQDLLAPSGVKGRNQFQLLIEKLPAEHKARWFAGAALNTAEQAMQSVLSTALSRLNAFLDSELEQILCFDTAVDAEEFCNKKTAVFLVMPEEDSTKYFLISLIVQQLYRKILSVADEAGGRLKNRVMFFLDEIGTIPKIESAEMMFSASRSRRMSIVAIIQSFAQLEKNYGKEGAAIIIDNCQLVLFGGFAPNSHSAEILSQALGNKTVMSGSISRGRNDPSQSLQMIQRPLMTPDELKTLPKGDFILAKTGCYPMKTILKLFIKWGIVFNKVFEIREKSARKVAYADRMELEQEIIKRHAACNYIDEDEPKDTDTALDDWISYVNEQEYIESEQADTQQERKSKPPLRTD